MIDTIVLRIHDLRRNHKIVELLRMRNKGTTLFDVKNPHSQPFNSETGEVYEKQDDYMQIKALEYHDTGKTQIFYRDKIYVTSSHYYLGYQIRNDRNYIELNFSIPKFIHGTNLVQFVPHFGMGRDVYFREQLENMELIQDMTYKRLIIFIKRFLRRYFPMVYDFGGIDLNYVEINRLDICFNQHFNSKKEALKYLEFQKRIKKKYIRETSNNKTDWGTSIFLQTDRYSAKIYHKGSEYESRNGERKHHEKINKKKGKKIFTIESIYHKDGKLRVEGLQNYADRLLRYEISFRNSMMSHLYRKKIFARNCPEFKQLKRDYKLVDKIQKRCERLSAKNTKNPMKEFQQLPKERKRNHKLYKSIMNKTVSFRLKVDDKTKRANASLEKMQFSKDYQASLPHETYFSRMLLNEMFREFNSFLKQFKVEVLINLNDAGNRVAQYNKDVEWFNEHWADGHIDKPKSKINRNKINQIILLLRTNSLDELVKQKIISRATKYNYIKVLKQLKLGVNQLAVDETQVHTTLDFSGYLDYTFAFFHALKLRNRYLD